MKTGKLAIWLVRPEAEPVGMQLEKLLGGTLFRPWEDGAAAQKAKFKAEFGNYSHWILIMATGIAVRFISDLAQDKKSDPAVVVLDEACRYAIALLSGHEGGANQLAIDVANIVSATPVITTATEALKPLILGIGCRRGTSVEQIEQAVTMALGTEDISSVREVATIDLKADEPGLLEFCAKHGLSLRWFSKEDIAARAWVTKPSDWVKQVTGADGVCEPCALMASPRARLIVQKVTLEGVAVAVAEDGWRAIP